ncbi:helix-turn-helix transcriptional regulator [Tropicibacter sp. R16_0]|uniref:helix-turn-helix transcriptional regulator n=1 Tax=Tropicibacter sp. R16_0 TaxID=2821102 RepID=UPI001ADAE209|nr:helix-turn-helix transcriptional regulator [Tropicibacter sp. R16_0]MBO9451963.1 helix-turn-helix transcriptional regulator [Tropicibacter sp. R16_0]
MPNPVFPDLSAAVLTVGQGGFQAALSEAIATWLGAERRGVLQYSRHALPHYLVRDHVPGEEVDFYLAGAYRFDPFFRKWREGQANGVLGLAELSDAAGRVGEKARDYVLRFQPKTGMADEIAVLCPKIGGAVDNYFFLRSTPFEQAEMEMLRAVFPTLHALHDLNQRLILNALAQGNTQISGFPEADAFAIDDSQGRQSFVSANWQQIVGQAIDLSDAVDHARRGASGQPTVIGTAHVISERLGADFPPAPNGRITFVVQRPMASSSLVLSEVVENLFSDQLTQREISICQLALRGFPSASIAEQLGIAVGTVKNHRKSIYRKLDITTERELFLLLLNHVGAPPN